MVCPQFQSSELETNDFQSNGSGSGASIAGRCTTGDELLDAAVRGRFSAAIRRASLDWTPEDGCPYMAVPEIFLFLFC